MVQRQPRESQHVVMLESEDDFDAWRNAARPLASRRIPPDQVIWQVEGETADMFASLDLPRIESDQEVLPLTVPPTFLDWARSAICHRDPERFGLFYTLLLRLQDQHNLLRDAVDPLVDRIAKMARAVRRDIHKMRAFVRFRELSDDQGAHYVAWFEPEHHIVRVNAAFFVRRFGAMRWSILTPDVSVHWDGAVLTEGPGACRQDAPAGDPVEDLWKKYYAAIFNPARVKIGAMMKEMPKRYWRNMPETALIPDLIAGAHLRERSMIARSDDSDRAISLASLGEEAAACRRCPLWEDTTQTVFGDGSDNAKIMLVGEQPGDQEDLAGHPFVGPAGQILDKALADAGFDRSELYVTNAVKHFKHERRGKRRIHQRPNVGEIKACRWWIDQERLVIRPQLIIALGATAAHSLTGKSLKIGEARLSPIMLDDGTMCRVTIHPSYLLRLQDAAEAASEYDRFVADLTASRLSLSRPAHRR
jgi:uracil-DNA glycosylase